MAEATFKVFKTEFVNQTLFTSFEQLALELWDYIDWFNNLRLHETLGYLTPMEFNHSLINPP
ncbi:MAG: IS3 family transposase [Psychrobacillus psychrodurans]